MRRLRRWTAESWALPAELRTAGAAAPRRADVAAAAVQRIADLGAGAERRPPRPVPRLADPVLADQLAVVVGDVLRVAEPDAVAGTLAELSALRAALGFR